MISSTERNLIFLFIEFIEVILVSKVLGIKLYHTSSVYWIVCSTSPSQISFHRNVIKLQEVRK